MEKINANVFLKVYETGSFRKAAEILGYTQAGISYIVGAMEEETGLNLFIREHGGVTLSPEGEAILPYMRQYANWEHQLTQRIEELKGLESGTVRVQIFNSISVHWIPGIVRAFHDDFPGIKIELTTEEDGAKAEEMVVSGQVDCSFFLTEVKSNIDTFPLITEHLMAVVSPDHPLADRESFPVSELGNYPHISMKYDDHTGINDIFRKYGVPLNPVYSMDTDNAALAMVSNGLGYCICAELLLQDNPYNVKALKFDEPQLRTISIGTRSFDTCSKACRKFIEYTRSWVKEHNSNSLVK